MTTNIEHPSVVSRDEWLTARKELLAKEKQLTRQRDALNAERRQLPWVKVDKIYVFERPNGKETLADLFEGRGQLIVYHFMFGPEWNEGCPSCSFNMDHTDGALVHLAQRDVTFVAISRAPLSKIEAFKRRMGWRFKWVSSYGNDFNYDYHVSFTTDEMTRGKVYYNFEMIVHDFGSSLASAQVGRVSPRPPDNERSCTLLGREPLLEAKALPNGAMVCR
jgi:predicted dithiol-disulfide oxidoreductase (DUF899 family)